MANPNCVLRNIPKRPFDLVGSVSDILAADGAVAALKLAGWEAKHTRFVSLPAQRRAGQVIRRAVYRYNIWKREPVGGRL